MHTHVCVHVHMCTHVSNAGGQLSLIPDFPLSVLWNEGDVIQSNSKDTQLFVWTENWKVIQSQQRAKNKLKQKEFFTLYHGFFWKHGLIVLQGKHRTLVAVFSCQVASHTFALQQKEGTSGDRPQVSTSHTNYRPSLRVVLLTFCLSPTKRMRRSLNHNDFPGQFYKTNRRLSLPSPAAASPAVPACPLFVGRQRANN